MEYKELRLGNWIIDKGVLTPSNKTFVQVSSLEWDFARHDFIVNKLLAENFFESIPLTKEMLLKSGFIKSKEDIYDKDRLRIWNHLAFLKHEDKDEAYYIPNSVRYVHQLQNLYFSLTGNELNMKFKLSNPQLT